MGFFNFRRYSLLVSLVYGKRFYTYQADCINTQSYNNCLIVGAGDGALIDFLKKGKSYTLIENSDVFCEIILAKNETSDFDIKLNCCNYFTWKTTEKFDLIVFPFFLDLFEIEKQKKALQLAFAQLKKDGKILIIDFEKPNSFLRKLHLIILYKMFFLFDDISGKRIFHPKEITEKSVLEIAGTKHIFYAIKAYLVQPPKPK